MATCAPGGGGARGAEWTELIFIGPTIMTPATGPSQRTSHPPSTSIIGCSDSHNRPFTGISRQSQTRSVGRWAMTRRSRFRASCMRSSPRARTFGLHGRFSTIRASRHRRQDRRGDPSAQGRLTQVPRRSARRAMISAGTNGEAMLNCGFYSTTSSSWGPAIPWGSWFFRVSSGSSLMAYNLVATTARRGPGGRARPLPGAIHATRDS